MPIPPPKGNPKAVEIIEISDPALTNAGAELMAAQDVLQLQTTSFKARRVIVRLDNAIVVHYTTNLRLRSRTTLHKHLVGYVTFGPQASGTVNGLPIRNDTMYVVPPAEGLSFVADAGYQSISYLMSPGDLEIHLKARGREHEYQPPVQTQALTVGSAYSGNLFAWGQRLIDTALEQPAIFNDSAEQRSAAYADLIEILLTTLTGTLKLEPERQHRTKQGQSTLVHQAERYALAHIADRLYVTDLCKAVGASERALEYAFRNVMGLSPVSYLTRLRLHRVHEILLHAKPGSMTVTNAAMDWGFWHFGEFARSYKDCFGESPSDTLRRSAD